MARVGFICKAAAPLEQTIDEEKWLVEIGKQDRQDVGKGLAITECGHKVGRGMQQTLCGVHILFLQLLSLSD
jgi:hypothetical protein